MPLSQRGRDKGGIGAAAWRTSSQQGGSSSTPPAPTSPTGAFLEAFLEIVELVLSAVQRQFPLQALGPLAFLALL